MKLAKNALRTAKVLAASLLASSCIYSMQAQETPPAAEQSPNSVPALKRRPALNLSTPPVSDTLTTILLAVPRETALQVVLDKEVRVKGVGQRIHGLVVEPVYAFDQLVIPMGTEVTGEITKLAGVSRGERVVAALDTNFTPGRKLELNFSGLILANGRRIPIRTRVSPGSERVIQFVTSSDAKTNSGIRGTVSEKAKQARSEAKREWDEALKNVSQPGKIHRINRFVISQLPIHPQYIEPGTVYFAELQEPLDFGSETITLKAISMIGTPPPPGSLVQVRLSTPLSSATAKKGDDVEAILSKPLIEGDNLILPQGSRLKGTVTQARAARRFHRNGQLRISFREIVPPDGIQQRIEASLEGVEAGKDSNVKLDVEGGAKAKSSKARYLTTAISVGLAAVSQGGDKEPVGGVTNQAGNTTNRIAGGAVGFKLIGIVLGATVHSRAFGAAMGAYGAGVSVYRNFIARGREVVFPKNTAMAISIGTRQTTPNTEPKGGSSSVATPDTQSTR